MSSAMTPRRTFLKLALGSLAGASLPALARAKRDPIAITSITDTLALVTGAGSNVVVFANGMSVVMIDGGLAEHAGDLLKTIAKYTNVSHPQTLFNTHWHSDHTGSNERLGNAGAKIIAHENTKLWLGADFFVDWENRAYEPRPKIAWPTETFYTNGKLNV